MKKIIATVLCCLMLFSVTSVICFADEVTRVLAGSDFQNPDGNAAGKITVDNIIGAIKADGIESVDGFLFCGDYDYTFTTLPGPTSEGVNALLSSVDTLVTPEGSRVLLEGNHDSAIGTAGMSLSGNNDPENGKYGVYAINEDDYMWFSLSEQVVKTTASNLQLYLNEKITEGFKAPIFVISHVPLHYSYRARYDGDGIYSKYILDVLNEAGSKGLNIIFLFGHNHSNGWDDYLGGSCICLEKGDNINICKLGNRFKWDTYTLNFTYMNAGYTGYYSNHNGADDALTMTLFTITDDTVTIDRYDANGKHNLKSAGVTNSYKNEKGYSANTEIKESGLVVNLTDVEDTVPMTIKVKDFFTLLVAYFFRIFESFMNIIC